jgi:hypothetical protein
MTTNRTTAAQAESIINAVVSDWDPSVLRDAAIFAIEGGHAYDFDGRPEDEREMRAFANAFAEIQA